MTQAITHDFDDKGNEIAYMETTFKDYNPEASEPVRSTPQIAVYVEEPAVDNNALVVKKKDIELQVKSFKDLDIELQSQPDIPNPKDVVFDKETGAVKHDGTKPRMDLIPPEALLAMGEMFRHGADKYSDRNWEKGMAWGRVYGSLQRHLNAYWRGEDIDKDSGKPHIWCACCCVAMLVAYRERGIGTDDRFVNGKS
jgi:hypothetical protein